MMTIPNFLVIGAAKSGTTSLRAYLDQHPEVFVTARGEPSFFAHEGETLSYTGPGDADWNNSFFTDLESYSRLFEGAESYSAVGEISPRYLYFEKSPERIASRLGDVKLIAILRHPVDRAYSHFLMNRGRGCEPAETLQDAIDNESKRADLGWGWDWRYVSAGLYHHQLQRYYARFRPEQIKVFLYEDLKNRDQFFSDLFAFLGVDTEFRPDTSVRHRKASQPKSYALQHVVKQPGAVKSAFKQVVPERLRARTKHWITSWNATAPETLAPDLRIELFERYFSEDCRHLEPLIGRSLAAWTR